MIILGCSYNSHWAFGKTPKARVVEKNVNLPSTTNPSLSAQSDSELSILLLVGVGGGVSLYLGGEGDLDGDLLGDLAGLTLGITAMIGLPKKCNTILLLFL